jgi:hypothetical protein
MTAIAEGILIRNQEAKPVSHAVILAEGVRAKPLPR